MASVKTKFRPSTATGKEGTIYYQIIQNRVIRQLKTDYRISRTNGKRKRNWLLQAQVTDIIFYNLFKNELTGM